VIASTPSPPRVPPFVHVAFTGVVACGQRSRRRDAGTGCGYLAAIRQVLAIGVLPPPPTWALRPILGPMPICQQAVAAEIDWLHK
jgi:hypothetical protein